MKSTGIIRRIDELGRVVIPKEIRKSMNLKEGAEMEIYTSNEGLILQKHSRIENLLELAKETAEVLAKTLSVDAVIVDLERVLVVEGDHKDKIGDKISSYLSLLLEKRKSTIVDDKAMSLTISDDSLYKNFAVSPIVVQGDLLGGIICFSSDRRVNESDLKSVDVATGYLVKRLEF